MTSSSVSFSCDGIVPGCAVTRRRILSSDERRLPSVVQVLTPRLAAAPDLRHLRTNAA